MIVQFADERLLGLLLVAEAEHRSTVSKSAQEEREPISPKKNRNRFKSFASKFFKRSNTSCLRLVRSHLNLSAMVDESSYGKYPVAGTALFLEHA